jgi:cytidine deaminase
MPESDKSSIFCGQQVDVNRDHPGYACTHRTGASLAASLRDRGKVRGMSTLALTETQQQALLHAARSAQRKAYAPYSKYQVGAAVLDDQGRIHAGCNVENAAYPEGLCAEASALAAMVLAGSTCAVAVLVVGSGGDGTSAWITPCGGCRQKLREFGRPDLVILSANETTLGPRHTLAQLLPESFGPDHLTPR